MTQRMTMTLCHTLTSLTQVGFANSCERNPSAQHSSSLLCTACHASPFYVAGRDAPGAQAAHWQARDFSPQA
eukprot:5585056-Amphidinium_carterae.1